MRKVLLIDDDSLVCEIITEALEEWPDTHVTCAHDGVQGAEELRGNHFDLALIDGSLPGLSGIQLAEIAAKQNTPSLLVSGHPDVNEIAVEFGFPLLQKPFSMGQLLLSSRDVLVQPRENVAQVKASAARRQARIEPKMAATTDSSEVLAKLLQPEACG